MAQIDGTNTYDSYSNSWLNTQRSNDVPSIADGDNASKLAITTTNLSVYSNNQRVGFIQSFTPSEQREITPVQELGTEGVVQMVPGNTRGGTIQITRFALYNSDIWNALGLTPTGQFTKRDQQITGDAFKRQDSGTYGNPFRTLKDQRVPLELRAHTILPNISAEAMLVETYYDCWISSYSKSIAAQNIIVSENVTVEYSDMNSKVLTGTNHFNP